MPDRKDFKLSAYHEAGHLVIAWFYGRLIRSASIFQDELNRGNCQIIRLFGKVPHLPAHELEREMDISMAGVTAEEQLTGKKIIGTGWGGTDYSEAIKIAIEWAKRTGTVLDDVYHIDQTIEVDGIRGSLFSGAFLDEFGNNVRYLISRPDIWQCVEAVANELLKHQELSGDEITRIILKIWEEADGDISEESSEAQKTYRAGRIWGEFCTD